MVSPTGMLIIITPHWLLDRYSDEGETGRDGTISLVAVSLDYVDLSFLA